VARAQESATLAAQSGIAQQFRDQQAFISAMVIADIFATWGLLNLRDIRSSWPTVRTALAALIRDQFAQSAQAGAAYFREARSAAGIVTLGEPAPFTAALPAAPVQELITATLDSTGPYALLARIKQGQDVAEAAQKAGVVMSGAASRLILNGARQAVLQSVQADSKAVAWMRVTASDPCAFCAMLASRGAVYKTEQAAGFLAHSACRCQAQAVFSKNDARALRDNDLAAQWKQATRGLSGKDAMNAWRRYWDAQHPEAPHQITEPAA
jgi:hypothetical protein